MIVTIQKDDGSKIVYKAVTDYFFVLRQLEPMQSKGSKEMAFLPETRGFSHDNGNIREIIKETAQCLEEMRDHLRRRVNKNGTAS